MDYMILLLNTKPFANRTTFHHSKSGLVWYSDRIVTASYNGHVYLKVQPSQNQIKLRNDYDGRSEHLLLTMFDWLFDRPPTSNLEKKGLLHILSTLTATSNGIFFKSIKGLIHAPTC